MKLKWFSPKGSEDDDHQSETVIEEKEVLLDSEELNGNKKGFFFRLKERLAKTRETLITRLDRLVLGKKEIDEDLLEELEEILITSDLGVMTTQALIDSVQQKVKRKELDNPERLKEFLQQEIHRFLDVPGKLIDFSQKPFIILVIGVNGVGKTTTIGKLAGRFQREGKKVLMVAGDTFRAAAGEQLEIWAERSGAEIIRQKEVSDPSAVVFDAVKAAKAREMDIVLIDTAGRLHTRVNLMEELKKIRRVIQKEIPDGPHKTLLILDATMGQNAISQARIFHEAMEINGIILTKLDGTAKGGIIVGICNELKIPIEYIGIGEKADDLQPFNPDEFVRALF
ncbi:MAG: signal recognition particle-docking protein FtsY [Deltaproteobacteria bacterium RBG_13_43_22]|nr:MAG: signal recognition particle-docking protein FtsY [Deltaproteobacteria bacterium RBG_13_43_22]